MRNASLDATRITSIRNYMGIFITIPAIALSRGPLRVDIEMPMFDSAKYNVLDHHETYGSLENMKSNQDVTDM